jgi:hypothetical protein
MSYRLVFSERPDENLEIKRGAKQNVFFENLPSDCKVYIFYYPGSFLNKDLANNLKVLGQSAGKNLFVNIAIKIDDPSYGRVVKAFGIKSLPAVIVTALSSLALPDDYSTEFIRIDDKKLLASTDQATDLIQKLFNLYISDGVSEALKESNRDIRNFRLKGYLESILKEVKGSIDGRDINFYTALGRLELKKK